MKYMQESGEHGEEEWGSMSLVGDMDIQGPLGLHFPAKETEHEFRMYSQRPRFTSAAYVCFRIIL